MSLIDNSKKIKPHTHVCMILDSSGSMGSIKQEAVNHFNEQVQDLRKRSEEHDIDVTLLVFSSDVTIKRKLVPIHKVSELKASEYHPSGGTALYDAIGYGIDTIQAETTDLADENTGVLFLIITDGQENSSLEYTQANLKARMDSLQTEGWTFTFMAANVDPMTIVHDFGLSISNVAVFNANAVGMNQATQTASKGLGGYMNMRSSGVRSSTNFYSSEGDKPAEEAVFVPLDPIDLSKVVVNAESSTSAVDEQS